MGEQGAKHEIGIPTRKACCHRIFVSAELSVFMTQFDITVVGGGLRGLQTALRTRAHHKGAQTLVVDRQAWPGNDVRTQRSNGFTCELGPFAFTEDDLAPHLELLKRPPRRIGSKPEGKTGWLFDGDNLRALRVEPEPFSFATGCEDLVQAYRRELDGCLRLGRAVTQVQPQEGGGFVVTLGGEVKLRNFEKEAVEIVITAPMPGKPLEASDEGSLAIDSSKLRLLERRGTVTWTVTLKPDEAKTLTYTYERYIPSQ